MTRFRFHLIKHKNYVLYIVCFIVHLAFSPVSYYFHFYSIGAYSIGSAFLYGTFILFYKDLPHTFFFTFSYLEILAYSVFCTIVLGADAGTELFTINIVPALFLFNFSAWKNRVYLSVLSFIAFAATFFIVWWDFMRPEAMTNGYLTAVTVNRTFYIISVCANTAITTIFLIYLSATVSLDLSRSKFKASQHAIELEYMANHDALTGLMNRRKISPYLNDCVTAKAENGTDYALSIFDIDNFKRVNDTYGHDAGDFILKQVTSLVRIMLTGDTKIARWGGEEFLILFPSLGDIMPVLNSIRRQIELSTFKWKDSVIPITLTFGVSSSAGGDSIDRIIIDADNNLLYGKQHGKNCVIVSHTEGRKE
jgi:diguanylate cyclase (GGDEF)-like protein